MNTKTVKEKLYKIMENRFPSSSRYFINLVINEIDKLYRKEMLKGFGILVDSLYENKELIKIYER